MQVWCAEHLLQRLYGFQANPGGQQQVELGVGDVLPILQPPALVSKQDIDRKP